MRILILGLLFFVLSPGVLLTIPAGSKGLFASGQTSLIAAAVHAVVFVLAAHLLWIYVIRPSIAQGFDNSVGDSLPCQGKPCNNDNDCTRFGPGCPVCDTDTGQCMMKTGSM